MALAVQNAAKMSRTNHEYRRSSASKIHLEAIEPADEAVDGEDDAAVVDKDLVELARAERGARHFRHEIGDFFG